jgi:outer membrane protein OmpA-like peptidoglycan-associated protein
MQLDQPWELMEKIGDLRDKVPDASGRPDRARASLAYQAALEDIADRTKVPTPPPREKIEHIMRMAQQTRALASGFVRGNVLMTRAVRDIAVEEVPVPVEFVRDSDEMTEKGRQYAEDTARLLAEQNRPRIQVTGHTDPDGSDQYNLDLSMRRAVAFKRFLVERGYAPANVEADGRGKRQLRRIDNEGDYSKDEIYQMQRRVEVKFR